MRITSKGQVTIPQHIRERYRFYPHTEITFEEEDGRVFIVKKTQPSVLRDSPFDYGRGKATIGMATEEIMRLTRSDEA